jgi:uncharacterized protein (TIGR03382 family)
MGEPRKRAAETRRRREKPMGVRLVCIVALALALGCAGAASGAFGVSWNPVQVEPLDLGEDDAWTEGEEWWMSPTASETIVLREEWVGAYGSSVTLATALTAEGRAATAIALDKNVVNNSGFTWTSFQVDLQAGAGATITNVLAQTSAQFADVSITDNGGGSFTILWLMDGGLGVGLGDTANLMFSFDLDGVLSFSQVQTPIPAPGALALFGLAGAAGCRRRR